MPEQYTKNPAAVDALTPSHAAVAAPIPARKLRLVTAANELVIEVMVISGYIRGDILATAIRDESRSIETLHERRDEWQPCCA